MLLLSSTSTVQMPATLPTIEEKPVTIEKQVENIAKTIKYKETKNDTKCTKRGKDGEYGCFQIMPGTWKNLTKKHLGKVKGFSLELERPIVEMEIKSLLLQEMTPKQIFKVWNSGNTRPCSKGINKNGTPYDSCKYVREAMELYTKLELE